MGMATRHVPGLSHPILLPNLQPVVGSCFSPGRSSPSASVQGCCCINRCFYHGLGFHVQQACICGALEGLQLQWHINCLELLAVWLALRWFKTLLPEKHVLVHMDNTATVAYINHKGGLCSHCMSQLTRHLLSIWGCFAPFMSQASSIVQPTSSHVSPPFWENGDSTPR